MRSSAEETFRWAAALFAGLAAAGVRDVVVSPGSRSTPLTLAALRQEGLVVRVVVDERSAGFFALGIAKSTGHPVALVATSGSAVANWMPAVVEANMGEMPLILLSADRPPELQDCGANQTMNQIGLFGAHVRKFVQLPPPEADSAWIAGLAAEAVATSRAPLAGPVHINLPLREPLVPADAVEPAAVRAPVRLVGSCAPNEETLASLAGILAAGSRGAIVCGSRPLSPPASQAVLELARRLNVPVFADILSGLRFGSDEARLLRHPDQVARAAPVPDWILRFGGAPVSKAVQTWLENARGCTQIVVSASPRLADPGRNASHLVTADEAHFCRALRAAPAPAGWLKELRALDRAAGEAAEAACAGPQAFEGAVLRRLFQALPEETPVFLGNSLVIRAADWLAGTGPTPLRLLGNRGLSGIDGNLSTAFGIAAASGPSLAIVGDLAFLHDLGALALGRDLPLAILLLDNGGGAIFDHLPQAGLPEFDAGWLTPRPFDQLAVARGFGLAVEDAADNEAAVAALIAALSQPSASLVRLAIDRGRSLARFRAFFDAARKESQT
ncbi:2-succinyl-5-enolpyruvyl-6-hydroxy-3-cyclohexene-1-carboxylic-acid synthase [Afifella pfennigii]|uniref:2-succinyl-5-enolpyruvyl-6-hydroxy-3- cyclohexene-1-carboxylic-acid synthase n=1 Tax=Afifella pfennigii TaxID=209897 RepID=UPI000478D470|nr:2-succinyl-5-enolpyruvyl-6-hydroxy-3-cyclohexene-1-carboxylic-acid synthase [Afifella pfennigii]